MASEETLFWFRRDLRLDDNRGLLEAALRGRPVRPLFIFDTDILDRLPRADARVEFIVEAVHRIHAESNELGGGLTVHVGRPLDVLTQLVEQHKISEVVTNEDYEPYARTRDAAVRKMLKKRGIGFTLVKDQVIFAPGEIVKDDGTPYKVYGAYARRWKERYRTAPPKAAPSRRGLATSGVCRGDGPPTLSALGFEPSGIVLPPLKVSPKVIREYGRTRNSMADEKGTSRIGVHLRFGTMSPRKLAKAAAKADVYLGELIWREFFMAVLAHFPRTVTHAFDPRFDHVQWRTNRGDFAAWCEGRTGYPLVDAGMRQLNQTGFMHNRARMIAGSFLCKHLLLDWRWGEKYFAEKLLDYEQAANVGNWQWVAGTGCDSSPYFRVFNPALQAKRFDPKGVYAERWIPELHTDRYPEPIVPHEFARRRALGTYSAAVRGVKK